MPTELASPLELYAVDLINAERVQAGLKPVHVEVHLNSAAQLHSDWMADQETITHAGEGGSTSTQRVEGSDFALGGSWRVTENVAYKSIVGSVTEDDMDGIHASLMNSAPHKANILDPKVSYIGLGLSVGPVETGRGLQDAVFVTHNFASTSQPVLVQEEIGGHTVTTTYVDGEPEPGTSQPVSEDPASEDEDNPGPEDDTDGDGGLDQEEDHPEEDSNAGGGCFVATAAYGDRLHPDVVALRDFRDQVLTHHRAGRAFIRLYRLMGPLLAKCVHADRLSGHLARLALRPCIKGAGMVVGRRRASGRPREDVILGTAWRSSSAEGSLRRAG